MQHNILCFILDTPHWGRYFHDCISVTVESRVQRKSGRQSPPTYFGRTVAFAVAPEGQADPLH